MLAKHVLLFCIYLISNNIDKPKSLSANISAKMYSILEQHKDGAWWYHPGCTYETEEKAEEEFKNRFWWDLERPHKIIQHSKPFPQDISSATRDMVNFYFAGGKRFTLE